MALDIAWLEQPHISDLVPKTWKSVRLGAGDSGTGQASSYFVVWVDFALQAREEKQCEQVQPKKMSAIKLKLTRILCILQRMQDPIFRVSAVLSRSTLFLKGPLLDGGAR